jgi:ABC-2 type transport system permease protein
MVSAAQATLDYHARHYSHYADRRVRMVEHPGTGVGLHAGPLGVNFSERFAELAPRPRDVDLAFAVIGHEMAHHWWGGQLDYAVVEGAPLLSEGLAWYGAMRTVEAALGREQLRRLRSFMRKPYPIPPIRRGKPLLQADDPYAAYRKGPFAMYALSEYVGVDRVNTALRRLVERHTALGAPLATSLDLYRELQAVTPDSLRTLLGDLFERNTYWELNTERVTAEESEGGAWRVTLVVTASKVVADSAGVETEVPLDEWVEIGVLARREPGQDELSALLYLQRHRIRSGRQTITVTVPRRPDVAGIDPYHVLDWEEREDDDNIERVEIESGGRRR